MLEIIDNEEQFFKERGENFSKINCIHYYSLEKEILKLITIKEEIIKLKDNLQNEKLYKLETIKHSLNIRSPFNTYITVTQILESWEDFIFPIQTSCNDYFIEELMIKNGINGEAILNNNINWNNIDWNNLYGVFDEEEEYLEKISIKMVKIRDSLQRNIDIWKELCKEFYPNNANLEANESSIDPIKSNDEAGISMDLLMAMGNLTVHYRSFLYSEKVKCRFKDPRETILKDFEQLGYSPNYKIIDYETEKTCYEFFLEDLLNIYSPLIDYIIKKYEEIGLKFPNIKVIQKNIPINGLKK